MKVIQKNKLIIIIILLMMFFLTMLSSNVYASSISDIFTKSSALVKISLIDDDLVMNCQMIDKNVFNTRGEKFDKFIDRVKQAVTVFENRQKISLKEYNELLEKKKKTELNVSEIERMEELYKRLYSYGLVEYMPKEFFETNIEEKIDELIKVVEKYIDKK